MACMACMLSFMPSVLVMHVQPAMGGAEHHPALSPNQPLLRAEHNSCMHGPTTCTPPHAIIALKAVPCLACLATGAIEVVHAPLYPAVTHACPACPRWCSTLMTTSCVPQCALPTPSPGPRHATHSRTPANSHVWRQQDPVQARCRPPCVSSCLPINSHHDAPRKPLGAHSSRLPSVLAAQSYTPYCRPWLFHSAVHHMYEVLPLPAEPSAGAEHAARCPMHSAQQPQTTAAAAAAARHLHLHDPVKQAG
jgi:hypothetical protein